MNTVHFYIDNLKFYESFVAYLLKDENQTNNTAGKYIPTLKTFMHWATEREFNTNLTYKKFKV